MQWASSMLHGLVGVSDPQQHEEAAAAASEQPQDEPQQGRVGLDTATSRVISDTRGQAPVATSVDVASESSLPTASARAQSLEAEQGVASAVDRATVAKDAGNGAFKAEQYDAAVSHYKRALRILAADAGPKAFGAGANVLVRPGPRDSGTTPQRRQRNGGLRYAMVMCGDPAASTVDVEYLRSSALAVDTDSSSQGLDEEEDDVDVARCEPLYASETGAATLQLSLHMNWARCLKAQRRPHDGAKRANVAVALAEADRTRTILANNDRIAGTPPVEVPSAGLVKAIYLRAQCLVAHKEWKRAEADLSLALELDGNNAAVLKLHRQLPKLKQKQFRDNKKLSKEMSMWLAKESDAVEAGLYARQVLLPGTKFIRVVRGEVAGQSAMDMAITDVTAGSS